MKLPGADHIRIDERKIRDYLLSSSHPVGRFKARLFAAIGFDQRTAEAFIAEIRRVAAEGDVEEAEPTEFGRKYTVPGELRGTSGTLQVLTVWLEEHGQERVRLVTVRPR